MIHLFSLGTMIIFLMFSLRTTINFIFISMICLDLFVSLKDCNQHGNSFICPMISQILAIDFILMFNLFIGTNDSMDLGV